MCIEGVRKSREVVTLRPCSDNIRRTETAIVLSWICELYDMRSNVLYVINEISCTENLETKAACYLLPNGLRTDEMTYAAVTGQI